MCSLKGCGFPCGWRRALVVQQPSQKACLLCIQQLLQNNISFASVRFQAASNVFLGHIGKQPQHARDHALVTDGCPNMQSEPLQ